MAAITFPLLVRTLLQQQGLYSLAPDDFASLAALPELLETERNHHPRAKWWQLVMNQKLAVALKLGLEETTGAVPVKDSE